MINTTTYLIRIQDHFDYWKETIDFTEVCKRAGKFYYVEFVDKKINKTVQRKAIDYPLHRCRKLMSHIAHSILWGICDADPDSIEEYAHSHNRRVYQIWKDVRKRYGI